MHFWEILLIHRKLFSIPVLKDPTDYGIWLLSRVHLRDILLWQQSDAQVIDQSLISPKLDGVQIQTEEILSVITSILTLIFLLFLGTGKYWDLIKNYN